MHCAYGIAVRHFKKDTNNKNSNMGLFDKLFGKNEKSNDKSMSETINQDIDDIKNYKFLNLDSLEINSISEYSKYISNIIPLHISDLNQTHILHPDNIIKFADLWFKTPSQNRMIQLDESTMIEYLGVSLGQYVSDVFGLNWCNAADMRTSQNGNVSVECALINNSTNLLFLPIKAVSKEIFIEKGFIDKELIRISEKIKPITSLTDNLSFEELVVFVKKNGKGQDVVRIWEKVLNLKEWHFLSIYKEDIQECKPFIGVVNDKPWFFVFTDKDKALEYVKSDNRFLGPNGESFIISQSVANSLQMIFQSEQNGVFGLMVNSNDDKINADFNIPISVLRQIVDMLNDKK